MIVSAVLVSHDGARWLPGVLNGVRRQRRPIDRGIAVDTGSKDDSVRLIRDSFSETAVVETSGATSFPAAVSLALEHLPPLAGDDQDEWIWLLHDDSAPDPDALAALVAAAAEHPEADILGPKLREWPSLRRLLELGVTLSGTGRRETGLERGEYDQGQHDQVREVLAVNTAGMLVRRRVLEQLGGLDEALPMFGNDLDLGWRAARAGLSTLVVPQAVVFHAEAAHRGVRRTPLTGRHTHYQERRAALFTLLANVESRRLLWQTVRLFFGTLLRVVGFLLVRSVGEALDELAALVDVYRRPGLVRQARRRRAREAGGSPRDVSHLLAPWWVPYRHGLDFVSDLSQAVLGQAQDVAERRRAAKAESEPSAGDRSRSGAAARARSGGAVDEEDEELLADTGIVVRFLTDPRAVGISLFVLLSLVAARPAFGQIQGGALSPVPEAVSDWWRLYAETRHPLGTGTDVPAPAYVLPLALLGTLLLGSPSAAISAVMLLAVPFALWGAWRFLRVVGRLVDPRGLPVWVLAWGAATYALVPATSGAWGEGRFGTVVLAGLLPWIAHAALGFADPEPDRRWRAAWRTGLLLALAAAFVPGVWLFGLLAAGIVVAAGFAIAPRLLKDRSAWGPPALALAVVPLLLLPWFLPLILTGSGTGLLLEAGRLPLAEATFTDLLTGRLGELGAPWWLGAPVGLFAVLAVAPRVTRVPVTICWVIALAAAVVVAALGFVTLRLPATSTPPSLGFFVVVLQGVAVVAAVLGAEAWTRRLAGDHALWQRVVAGTVALVAAAVPLGGLAWWVVDADDSFDQDVVEAVPAYMAQSSLTGAEHGVLVLRGSLDTGLSYRVRRDDGVTVGEDEVLSLADEDEDLTRTVSSLASSPTPADVAELGRLGIEYVVLAAPADGRVAAELDAVAGLVQASAGDRATRAWRVERPLDPTSVDSTVTTGRVVLLVVQGVVVVVALVLAAPTVAGRRRREVEA
ncbi:glycosyltransferase family 2 protein [Nocardioides campestrisoli]|uniref:glycosyltransferase family 2 protein n=1 Tax=Nocardioides campestrisoli TaxID=2736757 RepID=UPI0015E6CBC0|nr:glycosyltransferase family 2 protein [Nocardioides campestrisoli]